uniref:Uncharacterized protein n=1 Tax=Syphacia muris TaxID=451379 RepID=A0A0N5AEL2_9BILA
MSETTAADGSGGPHHGFSQKARGVLLQPEHAVAEKVLNDRRSPSPVAPHRGFNEKAREVLLNSKSSEQGPASAKSM